MAKKINIVGKKAERIQNTGPSLPRIEPSEFAAALGAEPCGEAHSEHLDPISLLALGNELLKRLRSTGGRPSLEGATEQCKVPLRPEDIAALEQMQKAIEKETGTRPSIGQLASVILRRHLDAIKNASVDSGDDPIQDNSMSLPFIKAAWPGELDGKRNECRPAQEIVEKSGSTWGKRRTG
jgi:hypothetical protein